jgi:hypothetical protein
MTELPPALPGNPQCPRCGGGPLVQTPLGLACHSCAHVDGTYPLGAMDGEQLTAENVRAVAADMLKGLSVDLTKPAASEVTQSRSRHGEAASRPDQDQDEAT